MSALRRDEEDHWDLRPRCTHCACMDFDAVESRRYEVTSDGYEPDDALLFIEGNREVEVGMTITCASCGTVYQGGYELV